MPTQKTCFVIMPFGERDDERGRTIDFNDIYEGLIKDAVEAKGFRCVRCDEIVQAGSIHRDMIESIRDADVAIVDITTQNSNVFYELGVRHSLKPWVTVLIRKRGERVPFNIEGMRVIDYDTDKLSSVVKAKKAITDAISNGLTQMRIDSLVYEILPLKAAGDTPRSKVITETLHYRYSIKGIPGKHIGLVTGQLRNIRSGFDIWVNSENTNMQMSRFFDPTISGSIRYLGAKKNETGDVLEDTIAQELKDSLGGQFSVAPAAVIRTGSGELLRTHNVRYIFHVASVIGRVGEGYKPIPDVQTCIANALARSDSAEWEGQPCRSILFPLIGTGSAKGDPIQVVRSLIEEAVQYLRAHADTKLETVSFNCFTEADIQLCSNVIGSIPFLSLPAGSP